MTVSLPAQRPAFVGLVAGAAAGVCVALQRQTALPVLAASAVIITPTPLTIAVLRGGVVGGGVSFGVCGLLLSGTALGDQLPAWAFLCGYGLIVGFIVFTIRRGPTFSSLIAALVAVAVALAYLDLSVSAAQHERGAVAEYQAWVGQVEHELTSGAGWAELDSTQQEQVLRVLPVAKRLIPAFALGWFACWLAVASWLARGTVGLLGIASIPRRSFAAWRLPEWGIFGFIVPAGILLLGVAVGKPVWVTVASNVLVLVAALYLGQGCAVLHAFAQRFKIHPLIETLCFGAVLFTPPLLVLVTLAGLFDYLVDFRIRWLPGAAAPGEPRPDA